MKENHSIPDNTTIPLIGILRHIREEELLPVLEAYTNAGLTKIEITMNTMQATDLIHTAVQQYGRQLQIGAGTVCSLQDLDKALQSGATFIVTPIVQEEVIKACAGNNIPVYPGAYTPTEIHKAWSFGATMVKVFPASTLGPAYIRDVKASMNNIKLLPVGGIHLQHIDSFIAAGADGVGIGSPLFDRGYIQQKNWTALEEHFTAFAQKLLPSAAGKQGTHAKDHT